MSRFLFLALPAVLIACQPDSAADMPEVDAVDVERSVGVTPADALTLKLNVNTATSEELATVPNAGDRMVGEFEEYRPYSSIRVFRERIGNYVDEDQVAAYEEYLFVPIDPSTSDSETLQQIPGIGPVEAQALIEARPYADEQAFLARVAELAPEADAQALLVR